MLKVCSRCKLDKPVDHFYRDRKSADGRREYCIKCGYELRKRERSFETPIRNKELFFDGISRECNRCYQIKTLDCFHRDKRGRNGYRLSCIACFCVQVGRPVHERRMLDRGTIVRTETHKSCRVCKQIRPYSLFYSNPGTKDGYTGMCKECSKQWRRKYFSTPKGKEIKSEYDKKYALMLVVGSPAWWKRKYGYGKQKDTFAKEMWKDLMELFKRNPNCRYCGVGLTDGEVVFDHKIPRSRGGSLELHNIAVACGPCNRLKGTMTDTEFDDFVENYSRRILERRELRLVEKR